MGEKPSVVENPNHHHNLIGQNRITCETMDPIDPLAHIASVLNP